MGSATLVGHNVSIGDHSNVSHSVIGQDCKIAGNCLISNSYIHDGVTIGDGCIIRDAVIGEGATIKAGAVISEGCLIGPGVTVGEAAKLYGRRVSVEPWDEEVSANGVDGKSLISRREGKRLISCIFSSWLVQPRSPLAVRNGSRCCRRGF